MLTNSEIENMKVQANNERPNSLHYAIFQSNDRECLFQGFKHWDESKASKYRQVCTVDYFGGLIIEGGDHYIDTLDEVFAILNGARSESEYDAHVKGFGIVEGVRKSDGVEYCFRDMHSLSVGDVIVDSTGPVDKAYLVDSFGFQEIEFNVEKEERFIPHFDLTLAAQAEASL